MTGSDIFDLEVGDTPPSLNAASLGSKGAHMKFHRLKKQWEGYLTAALLKAKVPKGLARIHATAILRFPSQRRRDEGNFRFLLEKALGDALQLNGQLSDDTPEQFTFGELRFEPDRGDKRTVVTLETFRG